MRLLFALLLLATGCGSERQLQEAHKLDGVAAAATREAYAEHDIGDRTANHVFAGLARESYEKTRASYSSQMKDAIGRYKHAQAKAKEAAESWRAASALKIPLPVQQFYALEADAYDNYAELLGWHIKRCEIFVERADEEAFRVEYERIIKEEIQPREKKGHALFKQANDLKAANPGAFR